jgi:hypothetical protein
MEKRQRVIDVGSFTQSANAAVALQNELRRRDDANEPDPTDAECAEICAEADRKATFGFDYKMGRDGTPQQSGIGSIGHETGNHFAAILRWQGREAYNAAVAEIFKRDPDRGRKLGLPQPARI